MMPKGRDFFMIFEKEDMEVSIIDVLSLCQGAFSGVSAGRNFDALSYRFESDAQLSTQKEHYDVKDGAVCFVPARTDYTRTARKDHMIVIHFHAGNYASRGIECFYPKNRDVLAHLFEKILAVWEEKAPGYKYRCTALLYEILAECYRDTHRKVQSPSKIARSLAYMNEHYKDPSLTVAEIASQSFMSEVYFRRLFKRELGTSPQKHLISLRIRHAASLIVSGYYTLTQIAYLSGYRDYKYFSVEFKRQMGVSPSEYSYNYGGKQK